MPYGKRKTKQYRRKGRKSYNKSAKGLSKKEKRQVKAIAQKAVVTLGDPKRRQYIGGLFHATDTLYAYGRPKLIDSGNLGGIKLTDRTMSIAVGRVALGSSFDEREGMKTLLRGISFNMIISWAPVHIEPGNIVTMKLISTMNDPSGGDLSFIPGGNQNASTHIPSLLCPPGNTMGYRYTNCRKNKETPGLDPFEYKVHWTKSYRCNTNQLDNYRQKNIKISTMFKEPILQEYNGSAESSILGRRFFLLMNSTSNDQTATLSNKECPAVHLRLWTYFRDRD